MQRYSAANRQELVLVTFRGGDSQGDVAIAGCERVDIQKTPVGECDDP